MYTKRSPPHQNHDGSCDAVESWYSQNIEFCFSHPQGRMWSDCFVSSSVDRGRYYGHNGVYGAINPFLPTVAFSQLSSNICCPRDSFSRHNEVTSGAPLKTLRDDCALRTLSSLRGLRGAPEVPPLCRETQSLGQQMLELSCE